MTIGPFKGPLEFVCLLKAQVAESESLSANITTCLENLIENWQEIASEKRDVTLSKEVHKLSMQVLDQFKNEGKSLAAKIEKVSLALFPDSSSLLNQLCPGYRENPRTALARLDEDQIKELIENFDKLGLKSKSDRITLYQELIECANYLAQDLADNFDKLGFENDFKKCKSFDERLELLNEISRENHESYALYALGENFKKLGIIEDINKGKDFNARLEMYRKIANLSNWLAYGVLDKLFDQFEFIKDFREAKNANERLELLKQALELDFEKMRTGFIRNLDKLGIVDDFGAFENFEDRFKFCQKLTSITDDYPWYHILYTNVENLGFIQDIERAKSLKDRISIYKKIMNTFPLIALSDKKYLFKFGFVQAIKACKNATERLALYKEMVSGGGESHKNFAGIFNQLNFIQDINQCKTVDERLDLCKKLVSLGEFTARELFEKKLKDGLKEASAQQRIDLYQLIAKQGGSATLCVLKNLHTLRRQSLNEINEILPIKDLTNLLKTIANCDKGSAIYIVRNFKSLCIFFLNDDSFEELFNKCKLSPLKHILPEIEKCKNKGLQETLTTWAELIINEIYNKAEEEIEAIASSEILDDLRTYRNPPNREMITKQLGLMNIEDIKNMPLEAKKGKKWSKISWVLLSRMKTIGFSNEWAELLLKNINQKTTGGKIFVGPHRYNHLVQFLLKVIDENPYKPKEIEQIAQGILKLLRRAGRSKEDKNLISKDLQSLTNLFYIDRELFFDCLGSEVDAQSFFKEKFIELFHLRKSKKFDERYDETFGSFRNPVAIFTYYHSMAKIGDESVLKALKTYVKAVIDGTFPSVRYESQLNPHLETLFEKNENLKENWLKQPREVSNIESTGKRQKIDYKAKFREIFHDKHLNSNDFPLLYSYLKENVLMELDSEEPKTIFQNLAIAFCDGKGKPEDFVSKVKALNLNLGEFENDLKSLIPQKSFGEYTISESDDPCDLLLLGTEITESCQRVDGGAVNKCLISYIMNGEIRPIVVKRGGKLVARSLLRLMWDDKNDTPVLLQERIYSNVGDNSVKQAIEDWAIEKAKNMGIPLVSKEVGKGDVYKGSVKCFGGFAPFTYSDASGGTKSGPFETKECHLLYM